MPEHQFCGVCGFSIHDPNDSEDDWQARARVAEAERDELRRLVWSHVEALRRVGEGS